MSNNDEKIESMLKRYRPLGPPVELKERIFQLEKTKAIAFSLPDKEKKTHWIRYAVIAASIMIVASCFILWCIQERPKEIHLSMAEIERQISQSANAARLLAAVDMLSEYSDLRDIISQQYKHIVDTYPETTAAAEAKSRINNL